MSDNTALNPAVSGDTIRTLDKGRTDSAKTEVVTLDVGGRDENILTFPIPVALADVPQDDGIPVLSLSGSTMAAIEMLFLQLIAMSGRRA